MAQSQSTPRKRVTREDIRKREIKLDIVERKPAPPLSWRWMSLVFLPIVLWVIIPERGALWLAFMATAFWIGVTGMLVGERKRDDFDTGREITLSIVRAGALGLALGCWAFLILGSKPS
ncbi:MAG: hypothetical protein HUU46_19405 [Candidatus Hydrogenedentes bacterium]|nr:hypothetical protein [Candidatus Hydrogenedentota bacterium]